MNMATTTEEAAPSNSVYKKPVRLTPDRMGIVLHEPFVQLLHIDDELTWVEQILTEEGILLKPIKGLPHL
jgi:hypothetical protein